MHHHTFRRRRHQTSERPGNHTEVVGASDETTNYLPFVSSLNPKILILIQNSLILNGSGAWDRTTDLVINSH